MLNPETVARNTVAKRPSMKFLWVKAKRLSNELYKVAEQNNLIDQDGFVLINSSYLTAPSLAREVYDEKLKPFTVQSPAVYQPE